MFFLLDFINLFSMSSLLILFFFFFIQSKQNIYEILVKEKILERLILILVACFRDKYLCLFQQLVIFDCDTFFIFHFNNLSNLVRGSSSSSPLKQPAFKSSL